MQTNIIQYTCAQFLVLGQQVWSMLSDFWLATKQPGGPCAMNERGSIYEDWEAKAVLTR